jgi:hypothetical protein
VPSYLSVATAKTRLDLSGTTYDEILRLTLDGVEQDIETYLGYPPQSQTTTRYYSGNGTQRLVLAGKPVTSVTSVSECWQGYGVSANFDSDTLLTEGTDYLVENEGAGRPGVLYRINAVWPYLRARPLGRLGSEVVRDPLSVKVVAVEGLAPAKMAGLVDAAYREAARRWQNRDGLGYATSESLAGRSLGYSPPPPPPGLDGSPFAEASAFTALRQLRRVPLA